jgi:hypothetical protein
MRRVLISFQPDGSDRKIIATFYRYKPKLHWLTGSLFLDVHRGRFSNLMPKGISPISNSVPMGNGWGVVILFPTPLEWSVHRSLGHILV